MFDFFSPSYDGNPFQVFGVAHIVAIAVIATAAVGVIRLGRHGGAGRRRRLTLALALILLLDESGWHLWNLAAGSWTIQRMLPLHLCSAMVWVTVAALLLEKRALYPLLYFLGVAGAIQALITPDVTGYGVAHYRFLQTMLSHGLVVIAGLWVVFVEEWRPTLRSLGAVILGLNVYGLAVLWINLRIGSNYLYVAAKPESSSVMDFFPEWPAYLWILEGIVLVVLPLMYLPFWSAEGRRPITGPPAP